MTEKKLCKDLVKSKLFENIQINIPNYKYLNNVYFREVIDWAFNEIGKQIYTESEGTEFIRSFVRDKLMAKSVTGHLTPLEEAILKCNEKGSFKWKRSASMGGAEWWVHFIWDWDFSPEKGCDLIDSNNKHVDIKLTTQEDTKAGTPGQFFNKDGIGFEKGCKSNVTVYKDQHWKWLTLNGKKVWDNKDMPKNSLYRGVLDHIVSFKIEKGKLDRYMFFHLDPVTHMLEYTDRYPEQVEKDANDNIILNGPDWTKRVDVTHSDWENGSILYTYEQWKNMKGC